MITLEYLRSFRIGNFSVFDFATAYLGVYLLEPLLNKLIAFTHRQLTHWQWMLLVLPLSIIFHLLTSNMTPLTEMATDPSGGYLFKGILLAMLYFGLRKV
jgi:hypothetical protein